MRKRRVLRKTLSLTVLIGMILFLLAGCSGSKEGSGNAVYEDMKTAFDQSGRSR